jgi:hypothetical protein
MLACACAGIFEVAFFFVGFFVGFLRVAWLRARVGGVR